MKKQILLSTLAGTLETRCLLILIFTAASIYSAQSQNKINSGTYLKIAAGTNISSAGDLVLKNGGNLHNAGSLILKASLDNQNGAESDLGEGIFIFSGSAAQALGGANNMGSLTINNYSGLSLLGNTSVSNSLNLLAGKIILGGNNLLLGPSATVAGNPSALSMVVATGAGEMRKSFSMPETFTFPVGDNDGIPEYTPVKLDFTDGFFATGNYAGVNLVNAPHSTLPPGYLARYWNITQNGISNFTCHTLYHYTPADVTGDENNLYCARVFPEPTEYFDRADAQWHQLTANWLHSFGTFTGQEPPNVSLPPLNPASSGNISVSVYPNPFHDKAEIIIKTSFNGNIETEVRTLQGQKICTPFTGFMNAGVEQRIEYFDFSATSQALLFIVKSCHGEASVIMEHLK